MNNYYIPLLPGKKYHLQSRAVGSENLFREPMNYELFLTRFDKYISAIADTYCYCLLPNHFHVLIRIKEELTLRKYFKELRHRKYSAENIPAMIMQQFSNLLNSYSKSYNIKYERKGALFIDYLRREEIKTDNQLAATIFYIHKNPVHHGYSKGIDQWKWSSFNTILSTNPTKLIRMEVLDLFGGIKEFKDYHTHMINLKEAVIIE